MTDTPASTEKRKNSGLRRYLPVIGVMVALIIMVVGLQAGTILYAIVFPPSVPLPDAITEQRYQNHSYGVDEWVYYTDQNPCHLAQFYMEQGSTCKVPSVCQDSPDGRYSGTAVITCNGTRDFSQFVMLWKVFINNRETTGSVMNITREIFWGGKIPQKTMKDLLNDTEQTP